MKTLLLQASSNSQGNTNKLIHFINHDNVFDVIDLREKKIGHFDYDFNNKEDDFIGLMEDIIVSYDTIVFVTPVYWFTMSGILKVFLDRFSDLLKIRKDLGRKLRGKRIAMISNSGENNLKDGFTMPFEETAKYLGMEYLGDMHAWFTPDGKEIAANAKTLLTNFRKKII